MYISKDKDKWDLRDWYNYHDENQVRAGFCMAAFDMDRGVKAIVDRGLMTEKLSNLSWLSALEKSYCDHINYRMPDIQERIKEYISQENLNTVLKQLAENPNLINDLKNQVSKLQDKLSQSNEVCVHPYVQRELELEARVQSRYKHSNQYMKSMPRGLMETLKRSVEDDVLWEREKYDFL